MNQNKYIKPNHFAEKTIIESIIKKKWEAGAKLPPERELSEKLGITRPTLRETLQRLSRDGWITIKHGRPTTVNNFINDGGLGILKAITNYPDLIPNEFILSWMEFRIMLLPEIAEKAIEKSKSEILERLQNHPKLKNKSELFSQFDWNLQMLFVEKSENIVAKMIFNDLKNSYQLYINKYFKKNEAKQASINYYIKLKEALNNNNSIKDIVKTAMNESLTYWLQQNIKIK